MKTYYQFYERGKVKIYEMDFNQFNTGKTHIDDHKERLFVCKVGNSSKLKLKGSCKMKK